MISSVKTIEMRLKKLAKKNDKKLATFSIN
jgi:hypothetical protein